MLENKSKNATKQINTAGTHSHARDIFKVRARAC